MTDTLKFKVAPHIVEDLGLNLYTSLPRVLAEFVANAYDADSRYVDISLDRAEIERTRKVLKAEFERDAALAAPDKHAMPLALRSLPEHVSITIRDQGVGMSRTDLQEKFLVAGRRRRLDGETISHGGRVIMGRKGLGKLAGFGVAKRVQVITRAAGTATCTRIELNYDDLVKSRTTDAIIVPEEELPGHPDLTASGTIVILSRLLFDPMKARDTTIESDLSAHFALIDPQDFEIRVNSRVVLPIARQFDWAWPNPNLDPTKFVTKRLSLDAAGGEGTEFTYRLRFTQPGESLRSRDRGLRVYVNKRLAAAPSFLDADSSLMHGFRMADYLDGVVHADFVDAQEMDYIATDRHALRWDSPLLADMRSFLSEEIREACKQYHKKREADKGKQVVDNTFTKAEIAKHELSASEKKLALRIAKALASAYDDGVEDPAYKLTLPALVQSIGHGSILSAIVAIANEEHPHLDNLVVQIARLTRDELENFTRRAKARLHAIYGLKKVVEAVDFRNSDNEKQLQRLFEESPWLIDPTYTQFLSADKRVDSVFRRLAKELKIDEYANASPHPERRPDLVFLIGNIKLGRIVIVELKSANKPLESSYLAQLELYMQQAEDWLEAHNLNNVRVEGQLLGSLAPPGSTADNVLLLKRRLKKAGTSEPWKVRDYLEVLRDTEAAHEELLEVSGAAPETSDEDDATS